MNTHLPVHVHLSYNRGRPCQCSNYAICPLGLQHMQEIAEQFITGIRQTSLLEYIAVVTGIASVWFSKKENILVYPVGLVNTVIYIYLSFKGDLYGEASVNLYYTIVSIYGWIVWARKNEKHQHVLLITHSNRKEWMVQLIFFSAFYVVLYFSLPYLKEAFN